MRTFELWVLNKWVFNVCIRNIPLQGSGAGLADGESKITSKKALVV